MRERFLTIISEKMLDTLNMFYKFSIQNCVILGVFSIPNRTGNEFMML